MNKAALRLVVLAVALIIAGCGTIGDVVDTVLVEDEAPTTTTTVPPSQSEPTEPDVVNEEPDVEPEPVEEDLEELIDEAEEQTSDEPEDLLEAPQITLREHETATVAALEHIAYVEAFWEEIAPELDFTYTPLDTSRLVTRSSIIDGGGNEPGEGTCSFRRIEEPLNADIASFNAYVTPCDEGITVVWDDIGLEPDLEERFPGAGMAMLMSHEWGHVVQLQREQLNQSDIIAEQQADCYSGAYAAWAEDRGIEPFTNAEALDFAIISTLETRDAVGSRPDEFGAHGNGFDRVRATQEGYDRGVTFCATYDEIPPPITQTGFTTAADRENQGNLPYEEAFDLLVPAVENYFEALSDEPLQPLVDEPDTRTLIQLHNDIGDLAIGTEFSLRYGAAVQEANGDAVTGVGAALQRACLTGAFLGELLDNGINDVNGDPAGTLSPGDLDEAIITFASSDELLSNPGVVFEMIAALRVGTIDGLDACALA